MWETFISWYINNYLGNYVENLNSQQLSFALRQGELELENVPLKKNIFRGWGLPIEVKSSVVGRIKIEFNLLKYFRNEPVLITIENVYLVAVPLNLSEWDPIQEADLAHEIKMAALDSHEGRWKTQFDLASNASSYYSSLYFSSMQIGASIVTKVIENLQLNVRNVHIRFEEIIGKKVVAFGVTLKSLTAQSCDAQWQSLSSSATGNTSDCSFKTLQLVDFAIYCDTKAEKFSDLNPVDLIDTMNKISKTEDFLLCPVSAEARISKNNASHPISCSSRPRFDVQLTLDKVPLQLGDAQFRTSYRSYKSYSRLYRNCRFRHYRPFHETVKEAPLLWWKYAVRAILAYKGYKRRTVLKSYEKMHTRATENIKYVKAYELHLKQEMLSAELRKLKDQMESELHYDEVVALREIAMRRVEVQSKVTIIKNSNSKVDFQNENKALLPTKSSDPDSVTSGSSTYGAFSYLFPSWSNWLYSANTTAESNPNVTEDLEREILQLRKSESELDESIMDDMKSYGRDAVLARIRFVLKRGLIKLNRPTNPFLAMDFSDVNISTELRPRSGAHKFIISLASLSLRDCPTKSLIVSPHVSVPSTKGQFKGSAALIEPIFKLIYERRPHRRAGHRISLTTKPLDLVVYPLLWTELSSFFSFSEVDDYFDVIQNRYEIMKEKTKEELRIYWERLINSRVNVLGGGYRTNWEISLDIAAPQIVIHGSTPVSTMPNTPGAGLKRSSSGDVSKFIVFDLGRFRFTNDFENEETNRRTSFEAEHQSLAIAQDTDEDDNEEFLTPCSSPVREWVTSEGDSDSGSSRPSIPDVEGKILINDSVTGVNFAESMEQLQAKLYKRYKLEITDIQIIVVERKSTKDESWKLANSRCTSLVHLVDRFSINIQVERRLVYSEDPEWPTLTMMATLPKLNFHLNKSKIHALRTVLTSYMRLGSVENDPGSSVLNGHAVNLNSTLLEPGIRARVTEQKHRELDINFKLFLAQFTIQNISVEIQSRGRSIAELQIAGARTTFTKWAKHTSISFVIHSILLADAVQTYGPDFELLFASHKHVCMDSVSGSLMDSEPASPMSPQSPASPLPYSHPKVNELQYADHQLPIPSELHHALLHSLGAKGNKAMSPVDGISSPSYDSDALITAELMLVNSEEEDLAVLSVLFNNLDIIANQGTMLEILQFLHEIKPEYQPTEKMRTESGSTGTLLQSTDKWKIEASFDFNRLNVLLLREVVGKDGICGARKIATATACDARIAVSLGGNTLQVEGSLGGLQMLNLTKEGKYHQRVLSVGKDPLIDGVHNAFTRMPKSTQVTRETVESALNFTFEKETVTEDVLPSFTMRMASVIYTHSPIFLIDLKKCLDQFQVPLANKLRSAAAQLALGLVRQDTLPGIPSGGRSSPYGSFSVSLEKLNEEDNGVGNNLSNQTQRSLGVKVHITLNSPVIALPRSRDSSEVLVANLGQITVSANGASPWDDGLKDMASFLMEEKFSDFCSSVDGITYNLLIRDVSLYSLDLSERWKIIDNLKMTCAISNKNSLMRAQELYYCDPAMAKPILHNTVLQFVVDYIPEMPVSNFEHDNFLDLNFEDEFVSPKLSIQGRVVNPLKVSVTPEQYAQVLDSLGNVAASEDEFLQNEIFSTAENVDFKGHWKEEINAKIPASLHLPSPTRVGDAASLRLSATFQIPDLVVELVLPEHLIMSASALDRGLMGNRIPQLSLSCSELSFECEKEGYVTDMMVSLKSLSLEDTSAPLESQYRLLAMSKSTEIHQDKDYLSSVFQHQNPNISESCPDLVWSNPIGIPNEHVTTVPYIIASSCARTETSSLPDHLDPDHIFSERFQFQSHRHKHSNFRSCLKLKHARMPKIQNRQSLRECRSPSSPSCSIGPATPPPSPRPAEYANNLVAIHISLVDRKSHDFFDKYRGIHKNTTVDFNTLDLVLTPSTFICLRKFFSEAFAHADFGNVNATSSPQRIVAPKANVGKSNHGHNLDEKDVDEKNTELEINVKSLRVKFAELSGTIAETEVTDLMCRIVNRGKGFYGVDGRLGALQIRDVSPAAGKFPVKFIFQGKQALNFDYCRKENEATFRLEMASVLYIHTTRFYAEFYNLVNSIFCQSGMLDESAVEPLPEESTEEYARVTLNIEAGAPVIFLPYSSTSPQLLVADLGHLSVRNKCLENDSSSPFDYITIDLLEMDLYSAELTTSETNNPVSAEHKFWKFDRGQTISKTQSSSSLLKDKCALNLKVKRLLNRKMHSPTQAFISLHGTLSSLHVELNTEKYKLIRGLLQYNIGEQLMPSRSPSPFEGRRLSRDLSIVISRQANVAARLELSIELDLLNVTLELVKADDDKLSRVDFLRSKFTFQNYSDGTRDIDLASQEILISDIRVFPKHTKAAGSVSVRKNNVFTNILQQSSTPETKAKINDAKQEAHSSSTFQSKTKLRAEVHLRETSKGSSVTVLLNSMRLMLIIDWWMEVQEFLSEHISEPPPLQPTNESTDLREVDARLKSISPLLSRSRELIRPVTVSTGIVSKRAPVLDQPKKSFDFKFNVSDCELVVVEDTSAWDTNAVILKITATATWRPHLERPILCNLIESEMFSCVLGIESETALSILDPTNVTIEVIRKTTTDPPSIIDATASPSSVDKILKIKSPHISLRLSYYDMKMFLQLLERFSADAQVQLSKTEPIHSPQYIDSSQLNYEIDEDSLHQLLAMGFSYNSSYAALLQCKGSVEEAALLLSSSTDDVLEPTGNFSSKMDQNDYNEKQTVLVNSTSWGSICGIEVKCNTLSICVIDDCKDADVPLSEITLAGLDVHKNIAERIATAEATISIDYYNRELCGWEPLLEPWKCYLNLVENERGALGRKSPTSEFPSKASKFDLELTSEQILNLNFTSTLIGLYKTVSGNWSAEYGHQDKRRTPFIPFVLRNDTGSTLWFCTIISNQEDVLKQQRDGKLPSDGTSWIQVGNGGTQTFSFEGRGKLRHRNTHQLKMHQLMVRVNGWLEARPVSVDRVGTYFRDITPIPNTRSRFATETADLPTTRLVFEVSLQGSAQKLVRIRSALLVKNMLPQTMELKLENTIIYPAFEMVQAGGGSYCIYVPPHQTIPIPLHSVCSQIWIRPIYGTEPSQPTYSYCSRALPLGRDTEGLRTCASYAHQVPPYRFCVAVKRDEFPADVELSSKSYSKSLMANNVAIELAKRANLISIRSPLTIVNLLSLDVTFVVKEHTGYTVQGHIGAGQKHSVTNMDTSEQLDISFGTENFLSGTSVTVSPSSTSNVTRFKLLDVQKRPLYLIAKLSRDPGGAITLRIACQYWIVNKSGLPLIIKQEGVTAESAGQFLENEHARMVVPLMFSFADPEGGSNVSIRVGTGLHPPPAKPHWCRSFPLQNGTRVRKLTVGLSYSQPEVVYLTGVEVCDGKGRYRDSKIVTIAPRFVIENRSRRKMQISQRSYATSFQDLAAEATHLTLPPSCTVPFHWPRLDKDQLLCLRFPDIKGGTWSGGFTIENVSSFHLNVRDFEGGCYFVRVETFVEGPTYFVVFSDTDELPPPFRIDNFSLVPIIIHQSNVGEERLKLSVKAESSVPYSWDEPTLPPNLTLSAPGGTAVLVKMDDSTLGLAAQLTYENFFYIAMSATFPGNEGGALGHCGMETLELVLDVPEGSRVVLRKKEAGNRNQLWRVNADGLIEHEGSSPPRDPRKPIPLPTLVLDIAGHATQPTQCVPLMLRKPDRRRICTQHWEFTSDGRLKCANLLNVYVQAKDGFGVWSGAQGNKSNAEQSPSVATWQMWNEAVLGPDQPICFVRTESGIPAEQAISKQKLRPGSGRISVYVDTDGPTRVLRIVDTQKPPLSFLTHTYEENSVNTIPRLVVNLKLEGGLGLSLLNCSPREELVYVLLSGLTVHWVDTKDSETVFIGVDNIQIDNQLQEAEKGVAVYVKRDSVEESQGLCLQWKRLKTSLNAYLFKELQLRIKPLNMIFEEKLLLKMCHWIGLGVQNESTGESDFQKPLTTSTSLTSKRFYFGQLRIQLKSVRLSLLTASRLSDELMSVKRRLGLRLIRFEETLVEFTDCVKYHPFETFDFLVASILKHYKDELASQALVVLGSVDFLGNPVGFVTDVSVGVSSLITEGSLDGLFRNVTHGISNSAAKVTGSLGDGLTRTLTLDAKHEEWRRTVWDGRGSAVAPLNAGIKSFGIGLAGGLTSIWSQSCDGLMNDGFPGLVSGLGKGIVGTVTKPAVGVLDLAAGVASAVRDSSRSSSRILPNRTRPIRVATGNGGLLPPYSEASALGQSLMYEISAPGQQAVFIGCELIPSGNQTFRFLVSSEDVTVLTTTKPPASILRVQLCNLLDCRLLEIITERGPLSLDRKLVIEFRRDSPPSPQVTVDNEEVAKTIVQQVNYARILFEEMRHSQINQTVEEEE